MAKALAKGSRITGAQRTTLASQYAKRYAAGESIRKIAEDAGRSFGFVHGVLKEAGVELRGRGGATRGVRKAASTSAARKTTTAAAKKAPAKKAPAKAAAKKTHREADACEEDHRQGSQDIQGSGEEVRGQEGAREEDHRQGSQDIQGSGEEVRGQEGPREEDHRQEGTRKEALIATHTRRPGRSYRRAFVLCP